MKEEGIKNLRLDQFQIRPISISLSLYRTLALECVVGM